MKKQRKILFENYVSVEECNNIIQNIYNKYNINNINELMLIIEEYVKNNEIIKDVKDRDA